MIAQRQEEVEPGASSLKIQQTSFFFVVTATVTVTLTVTRAVPKQHRRVWWLTRDLLFLVLDGLVLVALRQPLTMTPPMPSRWCWRETPALPAVAIQV